MGEGGFFGMVGFGVVVVIGGGGGEGACRKKWGIVGVREDFFRWYTWLQG